MESLHPRIRLLWIAQWAIAVVVLGAIIAVVSRLFVDVPPSLSG